MPVRLMFLNLSNFQLPIQLVVKHSPVQIPVRDLIREEFITAEKILKGSSDNLRNQHIRMI